MAKEVFYMGYGSPYSALYVSLSRAIRLLVYTKFAEILSIVIPSFLFVSLSYLILFILPIHLLKGEDFVNVHKQYDIPTPYTS